MANIVLTIKEFAADLNRIVQNATKDLTPKQKKKFFEILSRSFFNMRYK